MKEKIYISPLILYSTIIDKLNIENFEELRKEINLKKIKINKKDIKRENIDMYEDYNSYINDLKYSINSFLNLIELLIKNSVLNFDENVYKVIEKYNIDIDKNGYINKNDGITIIKSVLFNINQLNKVINESNSIDSYKTQKENKEYITLTKSLNIN